MQRKIRLLLPFLLLPLFPLVSRAQTGKGTLLLGGSLHYSLDSRESPPVNSPQNKFRHSDFNVQPGFGYFIQDNLAIGTGLIYNLSRTHSNGAVQEKGHGLGINPFLRYYKFIGEKVALFGQGGASLTKFTYRNQLLDPSGGIAGTRQELYATIMPGLSFFPTSRLGLQFTLGQLQWGKSDTEYTQQAYPQSYPFTDITEKSLTADFGFSQTTLGINYFLFK
jgi:hypothetical protein